MRRLEKIQLTNHRPRILLIFLVLQVTDHGPSGCVVSSLGLKNGMLGAQAGLCLVVSMCQCCDVSCQLSDTRINMMDYFLD